MREKIKNVLEEIKSVTPKIMDVIDRGRKNSPGVNIATLITNITTIAAYCTVSKVLAKYQGTEKFLSGAKFAMLAVMIITFWEIICLIGKDRLYNIFNWLKNGIKYNKQHLAVSFIVAIFFGIIIFFGIYFRSDTEYYASVTEVYGIPTGIGKPLSSDERKKSAGYGEIKDYPYRKQIELTYKEPYGQLELMKRYSTVYSTQVFQLPSHVVYKYKKNMEKYRSYDQDTFAIADANEFREPEEITYYSSDGKLLLKLKKGLYDKFNIVNYSAEDMPQLLNSTLLQVSDAEIGTARMTSQQIETTYYANGLPQTRRLFPYCTNTYGINGEHYEYDENNRLTDLYYLDIDGEPVRNKLGIMKISFKYEDSGKLHSVCYYGDEKEEIKMEGINGVFCERFFYDTYGNLITHEQLDSNGIACSDNNGVCRYRYSYYDNTNLLKQEDFENSDDTPVRNIQLHSSSISWQVERRNKRQILSIFFDSENILLEKKNNSSVLKTTVAFFDKTLNSNEKPLSDNEFQESVSDGLENSVETTEENIDIVRNYAAIRFIVNVGNNRILEEEYCNKEGNLVINENGYAKEKLYYDRKSRIIKEAYYDTEENPCYIHGGYAAIQKSYIKKEECKLEGIDYLDQKGNLTVNQELGYASLKYEYLENNKLETIKQTYFDQNRDIVKISGKGYAILEQTYNENGYVQKEVYYDTFEKPTYRTDYGVAAVIYEYDDNGNLVCERYRDTKDMPTNRLDTGYGIVYQKFDGRQLVEKYFAGYQGENSQPVLDKNRGVYKIKYTYKDGNKIQEEYLGIDEKPILHYEIGCAIQKYSYNEKDELIGQSFYGTDNQPIISKKYCCAGLNYLYDDMGNQIEASYVDVNGKLMIRNDLGYAKAVWEYDESGNTTKGYYFDTKDSPAIYKEGGYASYESLYENGKWMESSYYDTNGDLTLRLDYGYAIRENEYDEFGQLILSRYYGTDMEPVISTKYHCAGFGYQYDKKGNETDIWYIGLDGEKIIRSDLGYAEVHKEHDIYGNIIKAYYYDEAGTPTVCKDGGYSSYEDLYENGNWIKSSYYDTNGDLTLRLDYGYAIRENEYNEFGQLIRLNYYGTNKKPVISTKYHCAGLGYQYDKKGNETDFWYIGLNGEKIIRSDLGYAEVHREYDIYGNIIKEYFYDEERNPTVCKDGSYSSCESLYENGNWIKSSYYDTNGD